MNAIARLIPYAAIAAAAAGLAGCSDVRGAAAPAARPVKIAEVRPPEARGGARYAVNIQPYEQIPLSFKSNGYVAR